jgi:hypothetical protein
VDAVACPVEIQRGVAKQSTGSAPDEQIRFRIGVNLDDVIFDATPRLPLRPLNAGRERNLTCNGLHEIRWQTHQDLLIAMAEGV